MTGIGPNRAPDGSLLPGVLPDFLVIGGMKCGTTSLYAWLCQHPLVVRTRKEIRYFSLQRRYARGEEWYRAHFPQPEPGRQWITGEATPAYLFIPDAPERAAKLVPDTKLIALLRDPVERARSHWSHQYRRGVETESLDDTMWRALRFEAEHGLRHHERREGRNHGGRGPTGRGPTGHGGRHKGQRRGGERVFGLLEALRGGSSGRPEEPRHGRARARGAAGGITVQDTASARHDSHLRRGLYAEQLERWWSYYDRSALLVLNSEELFARPGPTLQRVLDFLELPQHPQAPELPVHGQRSDDAAMAPETRAALRAFFEPNNRRLYRLLGEDFGW